MAEFVAVALKDVDKNNHGQVARVAERFGLIAVAGKLATEFGIVSWPDGQVALDALELFKDWFAARGGAAPAEIEQMIALVSRFHREVWRLAFRQSRSAAEQPHHRVRDPVAQGEHPGRVP